MRTAAVLAAFVLAAASTSAAAGTVVAATGAFKIDGRDAAVASGKSLAVKPRAVIEASGGSVTYRSDAGDVVLLDAGSALREEEPADGVSYAFLLRGAATATLTDRTCLGAAAGWACAPRASRTRIRVESTASKESCETTFRALDGAAWVRYARFSVALAPAHEVVLGVDSQSLGSLVFRTGKGNAGDVEIHKALASGEIVAAAPRDVSGCFNVEAFGRTKLACDVGGAARIRVRVKSGARAETGALLAAGATASVSETTGDTTTSLGAVRIDLAEKALAATAEFTTLPACSFSDGR